MEAVTQTIQEGHFKGIKFRCTDGIPRKAAIIDWMMGVLNIQYSTAHKRLTKLINENESIRNAVSVHKFPGQGQKEAKVTDAAGLPTNPEPRQGRCGRQVSSRASCDGGSVFRWAILHWEAKLRLVRQAQQDLPSQHPARLFGEAVETGEIGHLNDMETVDEAKVAWKIVREDTKGVQQGEERGNQTTEPICH